MSAGATLTGAASAGATFMTLPKAARADIVSAPIRSPAMRTSVWPSSSAVSRSNAATGSPERAPPSACTTATTRPPVVTGKVTVQASAL